MQSYKVVLNPSLSRDGEPRYIVVDKETGEILDDAHGYGYKTVQKAHAEYSYKNRDRSKDTEKAAKQDHIAKWLKEHPQFRHLMDGIAFEIAKGSWGSEDKFDAKLVKQLLKDNQLEPDFSAGELLKVWRKM